MIENWSTLHTSADCLLQADIAQPSPNFVAPMSSLEDNIKLFSSQSENMLHRPAMKCTGKETDLQEFVDSPCDKPPI